MLIEKVINTLEKNTFKINSSARVLLGFSGGADSVCLLDILTRIGYQVKLAYFNHQLRPAVEEEMQFVKKTANKYKTDFFIGSENIPLVALKKHLGVEEAARFHRYQFLFLTAEKYRAHAVFTAHHADDQVETILMNIIRGAGLKGLAGMDCVSLSEFNDSVPLVRPLMEIWKNEILQYCEENHLLYMTDESNADDKFTRNRIRNKMIPMLEGYNPKVKQSLIRMGTILRDDHTYLLLAAQTALKELVIHSKKDFIEIDARKFQNASINIQRIMIDCLLQDNFDMQNNISFIMIEDIRKVINNKTRSHYLKWNDNLQVRKENNSGFIYRNIGDFQEDDELFLTKVNTPISIRGKTIINDTWFLISEILLKEQVNDIYYKNKNPFVAYLDANIAGQTIILQNWHAGMRYAPIGMSGHSMKLSDFWINKGFPKRKRDKWPLVLSEGNLIWVPGFQPAFSVRITPSTKQVLKLTFQRNNTN